MKKNSPQLSAFSAPDPRRFDDMFLAPIPSWELGAMFTAARSTEASAEHGPVVGRLELELPSELPVKPAEPELAPPRPPRPPAKRKRLK